MDMPYDLAMAPSLAMKFFSCSSSPPRSICIRQSSTNMSHPSSTLLSTISCMPRRDP